MALTVTPAELTATALTLTTAAQPNITSVGTLSALTVSGNLNATLTTAAQPNITSVGTLTSLTTSGNVSIGNSSPVTWHSGWEALQIGERAVFFSQASTTAGIGENVYYNSGWKAIAAAAGSLYQQDSGNHHFYTQASVSAGAAATPSEKFTILNSGNVGIGINSPSSNLHVKGTGETQIYIDAAASNNPGIRLLENGTNKWTIGNDQSNDSLFFYDFGASASRLKIDSSGHVLPGANNTQSLGSSSARYYQVWAGTNMVSPAFIGTGNSTSAGFFLTDTSGNGQRALSSDANNWTILRPLASGANVAINNFANSHNRVVFRDAGELCVGTNLAAGSISNTNPVVAGMFKTNSGTLSNTTSGTANTAVTFGNNSGTYIITATLSGTGSASNDNAVAIIIVNGSSTTQTDLKTGSRCVISMSSLSLQITQTIFTGANINWTAMRIGS